MKTAQEWCQELAFDFDAPRIDAKTIEFIQTDARADLLARLQKAEQQLKEAVWLFDHCYYDGLNQTREWIKRRDAFLASQKDAK